MKNESVFLAKNLPGVLSKEELFNYFKQARTGSKVAREKIILHNIRLVIRQVFRNFMLLPYEKKELVSIGLIGLIKAVDTFDVTKNVEFSTYAGKCINNEILMFVKKNGKYLNDDSLNKVLSIDNNGNELLLEDIMMNLENDLEDTVLEGELLKEINKQIQCLNDKDKEIIKLYFGFYNNKRFSQKEIGFILGISQSYLSRNITRIVKTIADNMRDQQLIDKVGVRKKISVNNSINNVDELKLTSNKLKLTQEYLKIRIQEYYKEKELNSSLIAEKNIKKNDIIELLAFIETPIYLELSKILSLKEVIIIAWYLGYLIGDSLSIKSLSSLLNIEEFKIYKIINDGLLVVKQKLNILDYSLQDELVVKKMLK